MKKKSLIVVIAMLMFNSVCLKAQSKFGHTDGYVASVEPDSNSNFTFPEIENFNGTYQFIVKYKKQFLLTTDTDKIIEENRRDNENVTLMLNDYLDVFIVSKEAIKQKDFKPFTTTYILK